MKYSIYNGLGKNATYYIDWPSNLYDRLPMKGPKRIYDSNEPLSVLTLLRTSLVYLITGNWIISNLDLKDWIYTNNEGAYLGGVEGKSKCPSKNRLPGPFGPVGTVLPCSIIFAL